MPGIIDRAWHDLQTSTKSNHVRVAEVYFLTNHRILNEKLLVRLSAVHRLTSHHRRSRHDMLNMDISGNNNTGQIA